MPKPKLKVGDKLKDREGQIWTIVRIDLRLFYPIICENSKGKLRSYSLNGHFFVAIPLKILLNI